MKKAASILLTSVFAFYALGYFVLFEYQVQKVKKGIKRQMEKTLPSESLTLIEISEENQDGLVWKEKNEFSFQGMMYDIVRKEQTQDGTIRYYCLADHEEKKLLSQLSDFLKTSSQDSPNPLNQIAKRFITQYILPDAVTLATINPETIFRTEDPEIYASPSIFIDSPPPKLV